MKTLDAVIKWARVLFFLNNKFIHKLLIIERYKKNFDLKSIPK